MFFSPPTYFVKNINFKFHNAIDDRQVPNAPFIRQIKDFLDERSGFFQHVVINVTWEIPEGINNA